MTPYARRNSAGVCRQRVVFGFALSSASLLFVTAILQVSLLPTTASVRKAIVSADKVEVSVYLTTNPSGETIVATITDKEDLRTFASHFSLVGVWLPLGELVGNMHRVQIVSGSERAELVIHGSMLTSRTYWYARVDADFFKAVRNLSHRQGRVWPSRDELRGLLSFE